MHAVKLPESCDLTVKRDPLVVARDLQLRFGQLEAAGPVSFMVRKGEFASLLGPSGCGKSSILRAIAELLPISGGELTVAGEPSGPGAVTNVGMMFQKPLLLPWRTTLQNVVLPAEIAIHSSGAIDRPDLARAIELLRIVGLSEFADAYPHQLSGGMQQRAALARTLMSDPDVLLLDEPFGALDEFTREALNEQLLSIWHSRTSRLKSILMVTHSIAEAVAMSDRILVLSARPARLIDTIEVALCHPRDPADPEFARVLGIARSAARPK